MCFSLAWVENLLIWLVIICAVIGLLKLVLVPFVLSPLGEAGAIVVKAINIFIWAIVAIAIIIFVFDLISCLIGGGFGLRLVH